MTPVADDCVVDMCINCMHKVWGPKMSAAIISSMEREKEKGNLELGRVSEQGRCSEMKGNTTSERVGNIN